MAMDISTLSVWAIIIVAVLAFTLIYMFVNRNKLYYKRTPYDPAWKDSGQAMYDRNLNAAVVCGLLIAAMTLLFLHYFHDWNGLWGMVVVDLMLILIVAYPARRPMMAVGVLAMVILPAGYLNYGPYAAYVAGPMEQILGAEGLGAVPKMAEKNFHCITILLTNPMMYEQECVLNEQQKAEEQPPTPVGLEITQYKNFPEKEMYPGDPLELYITFENQGGYAAKNFTVNTNTSSGAKYRVCEESIYKDVIDNGKIYVESIKKEATKEYVVRGKIADPWKNDSNCTYAINKKLIDASIKTNFSYDYGTESSIALDIARSLNDTTKREVLSAVETSSPMTILMHTFSPVSWLDKDFSYKIIPIRLNYEYGESGTITFRGKYEFKDVVRIKEVLFETLEDYQKNSPVSDEWEWVGQIETYDYCVNKTNTSHIFTDAKSAEDCLKKFKSCVNKTDPGKSVTAKDEKECEAKDGQSVYREGEPIYKARAKKARNEGSFDELIVWPIESETSKYINLSCGGNTSEETDSGGCICENNECKIRYVGGQGDIRMSKGDGARLLYGNLMVNVTGFPDNNVSNSIKVTLHANATYNVAYERKITLNILNPHYDK